MIWKNATKVGCNLHNGNKMFVCRYKGKDEDEVINNPKEIYNNIQQAKNNNKCKRPMSNNKVKKPKEEDKFRFKSIKSKGDKPDFEDPVKTEEPKEKPSNVADVLGEKVIYPLQRLNWICGEQVLPCTPKAYQELADYRGDDNMQTN